MSFRCEDCGIEFEWEQFYNNHRRRVHQNNVGRQIERKVMEQWKRDFLNNYYCEHCKCPTLAETKELAKAIGVKNEKVYWWFHNRRKKDKKTGNSR